jgi:hypothetical protein
VKREDVLVGKKKRKVGMGLESRRSSSWSQRWLWGEKRRGEKEISGEEW